MISVFDFMVRTGYWHRIFHTKNIYYVHLGWQLKGPLGYSWLLIGTGKREILLYQNFGHNNCGCYHLEPTAQNNQLYFQRPPCDFMRNFTQRLRNNGDFSLFINFDHSALFQLLCYSVVRRRNHSRFGSDICT